MPPAPLITDLHTHDFAAGGLLLVDKPKGYTSFDVVNKLRYRLRRITGVKRIKVGHSGTLDPMATGLLLIATGKATKALTALTGLPKAYTGTVTFGATTPSYDAETAREGDYPTAHLTEALLTAAIDDHLTGEIEQLPPIYSAIKVGGQRAYRAARAGQDIKLEPRRVRVERFDLTGVRLTHDDLAHGDLAHGDLPEADFCVEVSKGTYVRSLAHDLGRLAGSGAYLSTLRRTRIGGYDVAHARSLDAIVAELERRLPRAPSSDR